MRLLIYGMLFFVCMWTVYGDEEGALPPVSQELIDKLESWEAEKRKDFESEVRTKRNEVIAVLKKHMSEVTASGNLDGALAVKKAIGEQEKKVVETEPQNKTTQREPFVKWVRSIEMHETDNWWEIVGDEMVQHIEGGSVKRFAYKIEEAKEEVSFVASGRTYFLQFIPDRSKGIRSRADDWPARVFVVEPKR